MAHEHRSYIVPLTVAFTGAVVIAWSLWSARQPRSYDRKITCIAVSTSGALIAAGTKTGHVAVWRPGSDLPHAEFSGVKGVLNDLQFSPDEQWLAIADRGLTLRRVDRLDDRRVLRNDDRNYGTVRFGSAGSLLTITGGGVIEVMDAETGRTMLSVCCSTIGGAVAFSPDGRFLLAAGHSPRVWEVRTGKLVARLTREREFMLLGPIAFRGNAVLMGSQDGGIRLWEKYEAGAVRSSPRSSDWVDTIAVQDETGLVAYAGLGKTLRVWDPATDAHYSLAGVQPTSSIVFSPRDGLLLVGLANGTVERWDIHNRVRRSVYLTQPPGDRR